MITQPQKLLEDPFKVNFELAESPFTEGASILRIGIQVSRLIGMTLKGSILSFSSMFPAVWAVQKRCLL